MKYLVAGILLSVSLLLSTLSKLPVTEFILVGLVILVSFSFEQLMIHAVILKSYLEKEKPSELE